MKVGKINFDIEVKDRTFKAGVLANTKLIDIYKSHPRHFFGGDRECLRRLKQIQSGRLRIENGLVNA